MGEARIHLWKNELAFKLCSVLMILRGLLQLFCRFLLRKLFVPARILPGIDLDLTTLSIEYVPLPVMVLRGAISSGEQSHGNYRIPAVSRAKQRVSSCKIIISSFLT